MGGWTILETIVFILGKADTNHEQLSKIFDLLIHVDINKNINGNLIHNENEVLPLGVIMGRSREMAKGILKRSDLRINYDSYNNMTAIENICDFTNKSIMKCHSNIDRLDILAALLQREDLDFRCSFKLGYFASIIELDPDLGKKLIDSFAKCVNRKGSSFFKMYISKYCLQENLTLPRMMKIHPLIRKMLILLQDEVETLIKIGLGKGTLPKEIGDRGFRQILCLNMLPVFVKNSTDVFRYALSCR